jgi:hypothetical protein
MSQTKLGAFVDGSPAPKQKVYSCWTCILKLDIIMHEGRQKVHCKGNGLRDFRDICPSWTNGHDLANFPHAPEGFVPRSRT